MPLAPGTKLGPYEIVAPLGAGGMGEVYRARDTRLGRDVAIKVLPVHLSSDPLFRERFEREARSISSLNHPRICTLYDVGRENGVDFLVMEYLEGESLAERLQRGPVPQKEMLRIGMEVCEALEVAHRARIVHRDLKPGNIMLTKTGAKLMDFGLAKTALPGMAPGISHAPLLSAAKTLSAHSPMSPLTTAGEMLGTIQYMSPEQIEGKEADARSDIFALGSVLYEMATGKRPFEGKSQLSVASAILEKDPEPISKIQPLSPPGLDRVVSTCLEKNPDDRFQSARDVRLELKWIGEGALQAAPEAASVPLPLAISIVPWAVAALLAIGIGVVLFLGARHNPVPQFTTVTYREGRLETARFSSDGKTIVYSGTWEGEPRQIFTYRVGSPESRNLGIPDATLASISSSDMLAVLRDCEYVFLLDCGGTLATVNLAGGSPRDLAAHIAYADWTPDGKQLVVSKISAAGAQLEFPIGHVLYQENAGWFGHPKFSPDGTMVAFENHPTNGTDDGSIDVVDLNGKRTVLSTGWISLEGLDWSEDGKEVWFASNSAQTGWADTIRAVTLSGKLRTVMVMPSIRMHDISGSGRILLSRESWRSQLMGYFPDGKDLHPYSWLDDTVPTGISSDGRTISVVEMGEVWAIAGEGQCYVRATDGSAPVSIGPGTATISPDGKWVAISSRSSGKLALQPIGVGDHKELPTPGLTAFDHPAWSDDGRFVAYEAQTVQGDWNAYSQSIDGGPPILVKTGARNSYPRLSPDGSMLALEKDGGGVLLYRLNASPPVATMLQGLDASDYPVRFADGGRSLLVGTSHGGDKTLTLIDLASGRRTFWKRLETGSWSEARTVLTPDLKYYAYQAPRYSSVLYIVDNLH
jgi:eukaryotic-like serine/threonine-protein kinase